MGIGTALFILFLVFMILKLCHVIFWSWFLIILPLLAIPLFFIGLFLVIATHIIIKHFKRKKGGKA